MSQLALVSIGVGAAIIAIRGPLLLAPEGTLVAYRWLLASHARIRVMGVFLVGVGVLMILSARGSQEGAAWVISTLGWLFFLIAALFLLVFTPLYQRAAEAMLSALDDPPLLRALGAVAVILGAFLVYLGIQVF